jgi:signal transduction histidine kinase
MRRGADEHWNRRLDLERQLHDGPALRIAALTLQLGLLARKVRDGDDDLEHHIEDLQAQLHHVTQELRAIADQIYPPLLQEAGLGPAVRELAGSAQVPVRVDAVDGRFGPAAEGVAYFAVREVLQDLRRTTRTVDITVRREDDGLVVDFANVDTGQAVAVHDRIRRLGGTVEIVGGPVLGAIKVKIPCG